MDSERKLGLKPWPQVVDIFNYENNEDLTETEARTIAARALNKILKVLVKDPESREIMSEHLRPSEFQSILESMDEVKE